MATGGSVVGFFKGVRPRSALPKLPTLRFRGKISLGFAVVLAISAVSMGFAYLGFGRVSDGVAAYRASVSETGLAQNIDRELISYRSLARYYVATGKEDDAKAALAAEGALKDAIDQSMRNTTNPARINQVTRLAREFHAFTKIFADVVKTKRDSELVSQNQLMRSGNLLRYKLDDLPSGVEDDTTLAAVTMASKKVAALFQTAAALASTFIVNSDQSVAASAVARLKFVEAALQAIPAEEPKVAQAVKDAAVQLEEYRKALTKLIENAKEVDELSIEMADSTAAILKASNAMKADLLADQQRLDSEFERHHQRDAASGGDAGDWRLPVGRPAGRAAGCGNLAADDCDVQGDARTRRRQFRCRAARARPQGRGRRDGRGGRGIQDSGGRQGRTRRGSARCPEQGLGCGTPRRTHSLCRRVRGRRGQHRCQCFGLGRTARNPLPGL